ncbi:alpha/beta-hydrolase [Thelephora ganbajun]|uniref:Alpha/beta-hydrolase n=1 Tax=Thelephora ganbajun TaxID=370292 RepID=A0ACB6ZU94_THEGA|nr:alpha/beta-hydrolase [Thelephora ganbajun]
MLYDLLPSALRFLITSLLWKEQYPRPPDSSLTFELRHEHAVTDGSLLVFSDIPKFRQLASEDDRLQYSVKTKATQSHVFTQFLDSWDEVEVLGPNVTDRETLHTLAMMTNNAYYQDPKKKGWYDLSPDWNTTHPFGWEPDADGFRGHIFVSTDNSTVIVTVKGTSAFWLIGDGGPTVRKDKLNDNLLFSCCCAKVGPAWTPVCDCHSGGYTCDQGCLEKSLIEDSLFYPVGVNLYYNVTYLYPNAKIWMIGHSLGGALASLVGVTFGAPIVAFEAPGEKLAAARLHINLPPSTQHITHVYNTGDPIPMGVCTGVSSTCALGGYALESKCHLGNVVLYDTVTKLKWSVGIGNHGIRTVVDLLSKDFDPENNVSVPIPEPQKDCIDCFDWEFGDYR